MTKTEIVHQFYVSLAKGDFEKVGSLLADNLVWHQPGKGALSGSYKSKEAVFSHTLVSSLLPSSKKLPGHDHQKPARYRPLQIHFLEKRNRNAKKTTNSYMNSFWNSAVVSVLSKWIKDGMKVPAEKIASLGLPLFPQKKKSNKNK